MTARITTVTGMILLAVLSRLIPHPPNATAVTALALFGGAYFDRKRWAFLVPMAAMLLSDLIIGFHEHVAFVYGSFLVITCIGCWLREHRRPLPVAAATFFSSTLFFMVTNFGVWSSGTIYPRTVDGLSACYVAALPFFGNAIAGDVVYSLGLFGSIFLAEHLRSAQLVGPAAGTVLVSPCFSSKR